MAENCPFCDIRQFEERLIAEVDGFYIIATLGQITDGGYVLVFPKRHVSCIGAMEESEVAALSEAYKKAFGAIMDEYGKEAFPGLMFEHGIVGQTIKHAHLHIMPGQINIASKIRKDFLEKSYKSEGLPRDAKFPQYLRDLYYRKQRPYLFWRDTETSYYPIVLWDPPAPSQYLRIITAEAIGRPERANWRTMDPKLDKRLWSDTVRCLKPYFV